MNFGSCEADVFGNGSVAGGGHAPPQATPNRWLLVMGEIDAILIAQLDQKGVNLAGF